MPPCLNNALLTNLHTELNVCFSLSLAPAATVVVSTCSVHTSQIGCETCCEGFAETHSVSNKMLPRFTFSIKSDLFNKPSTSSCAFSMAASSSPPPKAPLFGAITMAQVVAGAAAMASDITRVAADATEEKL